MTLTLIIDQVAISILIGQDNDTENSAALLCSLAVLFTAFSTSATKKFHLRMRF